MLSLLAAAAVWAGAVVHDKSLPDAVRADLGRVEASAMRATSFRRLLAESQGIERGFGDLPAPEFVRFEREPTRRLAYDAARLKAATDWDRQLAEARELARASLSLPLSLVELEAAAWRQELAFALELAAIEPSFSKAWVERARRVRQEEDAARRHEDWTLALPERFAARRQALPAGELDRLALFAVILAESSDRFYEAVGQLAPLPADTCRLAEVADFLAVHGSRVTGLKPAAGEPFTRVAGQRYPTRVVRAAQALHAEGGAEVAKELVGLAEDESAELSRRLRYWLKWPTP